MATEKTTVVLTLRFDIAVAESAMNPELPLLSDPAWRALQSTANQISKALAGSSKLHQLGLQHEERDWDVDIQRIPTEVLA